MHAHYLQAVQKSKVSWLTEEDTNTKFFMQTCQSEGAYMTYKFYATMMENLYTVTIILKSRRYNVILIYTMGTTLLKTSRLLIIENV